MSLATQNTTSADWVDSLAGVQLETRQAGARTTYALDAIDFLIGSVPGCDLRIPGEGAPGVLCLFARHRTGVALRKLAKTQTILVNGQAISERELADGDRVQIGMLDILVRVSPGLASDTGDLTKAKESLHEAVTQFRAKLVQFQNEKDAFEHQKEKFADRPDTSTWETQRAQLQDELQERKNLLEERSLELERQKSELAKARTEMAELRKQIYDHYQDRRDRLASMQDDLETAKLDISERTKKLELEEQDAGERRRRDRARQDEVEQRSAEISQRTQRLDDERKLFEQRQKEALDDWARKNAELEGREKRVADEANLLDFKLKQYEADVLRSNRREGELEKREAAVQRDSEELTSLRENLQTEGAELEAQLMQLDEQSTRITAEAERLTQQKQEQDQLGRQLAERAASLEGTQASMTVLRGRLERMREETRAREQKLDVQRAEQETRDADLTRRQHELDQQQAEIQSEQRQYAQDRAQWLQRSAVMETAVRQLKEAQDDFASEQERLRREALALDDARLQLSDADGVLQGRLNQLAEAQQRLDLERKALGDRGGVLLQREEACQTLQEQLHRRTEEIAARHKEITERLQEYQAKCAELDDRKIQLDQREKELNEQLEAIRRELELKAKSLEQQQLQVNQFDGAHQDQLNQLAIQRKAHADERAQFLLEQQNALEKFAQARTDLETMRRDALALIEQLPDAELRAGAAVDRLGHAREQLGNHLGEIHQYVRQCQEELAQLRGRLQGDLDKLVGQEEALRRNQDEHRLAAVAFRQQLIDWQGQITDLRRLLTRDESRLDRREAQAEERARVIAVESQRLAQQAEDLQVQERDVADRRQEMDQHLVDMRDWYRHKLRELAGIPLVPDLLKSEEEPTILPVPVDAALPASGSEVGGDGENAEDPGIVPTSRSILSIAIGAEPGDRRLGQVLRDLQLIDADTLTALLAEARRQRRSLRQVLLASGVITLYQLALIEAGNVDGLMLGPVRIIDRLRSSVQETVYRVFDPRRGAEAVLRHLAEAAMSDAVKPDEFRQRFTQAKLNDPHVANTLEVLDLAGRPAAMQEWLTGLPATDWPPLAAAPGVCYRLLTQAAQGLAAAHQAGAVHGHLSDALLLLTGDGVLKILGFGEPPWLVGWQQDQEPTARDDLRMLGKIASGWCTPTGVRKGAKTKPLPESLVSILYRLAAEGDAGYRDVKDLLDDLQKASTSIPPNGEAWDRLVKYVREHGTAEALVRQSA